MPNRFSTFLVSTSRILPASIDSIGFSNLTGIFSCQRSLETNLSRGPSVGSRGPFVGANSGGKEFRQLGQGLLRAEDARMSKVMVEVRGRKR